MNPSPPVVLLVDDNEDDVFIFTRICTKIGARHAVQVVRDGAEAIRYLAGEGGYADRKKYPLPNLVLLDLKLPFLPGLEVLAWMRAHSEFATTPVAVLTSSAELRDIARARKLQAGAYLVKPPTRAAVQKLFSELEKASGSAPTFEVEGNRFSGPPFT